MENRELQITFYMKHKLIRLENLLCGLEKRPSRAGFGPRAILCPPLVYLEQVGWQRQMYQNVKTEQIFIWVALD